MLDPRDVCPNVPETPNGHAEEDGCPDSVVNVEVLVRGVDDLPAETAIVDGVSAEPATVVLGEVSRLRSLAGRHPVTVEAEGYRPWTGEFTGFGGADALTVDLVPIRYAHVKLRAVTAEDAPLAAWVRRGAASGTPLENVPLEGASWRVEAAPGAWSVYAKGYAARTVSLAPTADEHLDLVVVLAPTDVRVEGDRLRTDRSIRFALDKAELREDALAVLDDIVALLAARPDIELLRIEGHADESGTSRHNLDLSRARAEAVVAALVARGIAPGRLEAIGSGEAREARTERAVDFVVLVWADR